MMYNFFNSVVYMYAYVYMYYKCIYPYLCVYVYQLSVLPFQELS